MLEPRRIAVNVDRVRARIAAAATRVGRDPSHVRLVAVTKYVGPDEVRALAAAGCGDMGESRPQELWRKCEQLGDLDVRWHLIGHLQRNKIRRTLPWVYCIHSLDSERLLESLEEAVLAEGASEKPPDKLARRVPILLEVNISGDTEKHGFAPDEIEPVLARLERLPHVETRGLMTMASREGDRESARADFARLRELRDRLLRVAPPGVSLRELSMGMSGDFEEAIAEGATIVRIGSALFETSA